MSARTRVGPARWQLGRVGRPQSGLRRGQPAPGGGGSVVGSTVGDGVGLTVAVGGAVGLAVGAGDVGEAGALVGLLDGRPSWSQATPSPSRSSSGR